MRTKKAANPTLARRLPGFDARHATRRARRTRGLFTTVLVVLVAAGATVYLVHHFARTARRVGSAAAARSSSSSSSSSSLAPEPGPSPPTSSVGGTLSVTASSSPFQLPAPVAAEVVLGASGANLVVIGGVTTGGTLASGVFAFDTSSGNLVQVGDLTSPDDDAAGAVVAGQDMVFGGSSTGGAIATVQSVEAQSAPEPSGTGTGNSGVVPVASVVGTLPQPRAETAATTIGDTTYLVGGGDGASLDPEVLATVDGRSFAGVARLADPVESAAVAAIGDEVYVFGGQSTSASGVSSSVNAIQVVDPRTHRARVVGHLPEALCGAGAAEVGGQVLVIGGAAVAGAVGTGAVGTGPEGTASANAPSCGGSPATTSSGVWWFDPSTDKVVRVATLPEAVSSAGVTPLGTTVWVVGGDSNGIPVSAVQSLEVTFKPTHRR